jgi:uncharacterized protein
MNNFDMENSDKQLFTNSLIHETSPYLLQHAHNPVNWYAWGTVDLEKARAEDKLIIVSIGYSACHWCHVMEHESFEDTAVARIMNDNFISIKVDREERPDIDNIYMDAVHLMGQRGGWPLNCITLPDGRPVYGGTYFPNENWKSILTQLAEVYRTDKAKMLDYATQLTTGMKQQTLIQVNSDENSLSTESIDKMVAQWQQIFDQKWGGSKGAPKFPMPNSLSFLLRYYYFSKNEAVKKHLETTLDRMASGGIYDQLGGGFARYSTDEYWKVPHFEKMLYDNAQLISLYSEAYKLFRKPRYKEVVFETIDFMNRELTNTEGGFYSSLDADSEGEEGKFYVWRFSEAQKILGDNAELFNYYYGITQQGNWEHGINILHSEMSIEAAAGKYNLSTVEAQKSLKESKELLLKERAKRVRPATDTKVLTAWNALAISAYVDAYRAFGEEYFLEIAEKQADFLSKTIMLNTGELYRMKKNDGTFIPGFLDDYALLAKAYIDLYQAGFNQEYLDKSKQIVDFAYQNFFDSSSDIFFYSAKSDKALFAQKHEITDNVIPSSNSIMANVLNVLGIYYDTPEWLQLSKQMLNNVSSGMIDHGIYYSNWGILAIQQTYNWSEVVFSGANAITLRNDFDKEFQFCHMAGSIKESQLPILLNRYAEGENQIYVCYNRTCKLPVKSVKEALEQVQ